MKKELIDYRKTVLENYENLRLGKSNCIPFSFEKLRSYYPGHDRGMLLGVTGSAKSGKTSIVSNLFFYSTMDYLYEHNNAFPCHFLWFSLEEPIRKFYARLDSYLLNKYYNIRIDYNTLMSKLPEKKMPQNVLDIWLSDEYKSLVSFYTTNVTVIKNRKYAEDILMEIDRFAAQLGTVSKQPNMASNGLRQKIVNYKSNFPDGYFFVVIDNLTNIQATREEHIKYQAIEHLCSELVSLKDLYNFCFVVIIQQNKKETGSLKAFLNDNILSNAAGIRDYPSLEQDCTDLWAITNPCEFQQLREFPPSGGYDLEAFKRNYFRVLQFVVSRNGEPSPPIPLFFDGATSQIEMLPPPDDYLKLKNYYNKINNF
jgi:replicative DNA helicase